MMTKEQMRYFNVSLFYMMLKQMSLHRVKRVCFKTLVDEVQELEALSKDPGAVVHGKRYTYEPFHQIFSSLDLDLHLTLDVDKNKWWKITL